MGLMDKLGNKLEKAMSRNLTGESKEQYEKEKAEKAERQEQQKKAKEVIQAEFESMATVITKRDLKDFPTLIKNCNYVDQNNLWLAGFSNFKTNYNAIAANLLTGKKYIKVLTKKENQYYLLHILDNKLIAFKTFTEEDVAKVYTKLQLLSRSLKVVFKDGSEFSIDVTINKDKVKEFKSLLA